MLNQKFELIEESVGISANIKAEFNGVYLKTGISDGRRWTKFSIHFKCLNWGNYLHENVWKTDLFSEMRNTFAGKMSEIYNVFGLEWNKIEQFNNWNSFFEKIINDLNQFKGETVYIKTIPKPYWKDKEKVEATLASVNFISKNPDLKYTIIEENTIEGFGMDAETGDITPSPTIKVPKRMIKMDGITKENGDDFLDIPF